MRNRPIKSLAFCVEEKAFDFFSGKVSICCPAKMETAGIFCMKGIGYQDNNRFDFMGGKIIVG